MTIMIVSVALLSFLPSLFFFSVNLFVHLHVQPKWGKAGAESLDEDKEIAFRTRDNGTLLSLTNYNEGRLRQALSHFVFMLITV